jgi:hypothetical protein
MNPGVELHLSLILFLPWFAILSVLYWVFPRRAAGTATRVVDLAVVLGSLGLSVWAMRWGYLAADPQAGAIWKQVLATLTAYGAFLLVLGGAWSLRLFQFRRQSSAG